MEQEQKRLLIRGARILNPARGEDYIGNILISGDRISAVSENLYDADAEVIEAKGLTAVPGFVDMHVHLRDPGFTDKEDIYTGCRAAAAGGVTSLLCMPNTKPAVDTPETVRYILDKAAQGGPIALIEENDLIEIDIPQRILRVVGINGEKCSEEEVQRVFNERRKALPPFKSRYTHGVLKRFTQTAHSPMQGGYMD